MRRRQGDFDPPGWYCGGADNARNTLPVNLRCVVVGQVGLPMLPNKREHVAAMSEGGQLQGKLQIPLGAAAVPPAANMMGCNRIAFGDLDREPYELSGLLAKCLVTKG